MIGRLLQLALMHRWVMLLSTFAISVLGALALVRLSLNAYPDISPLSVWVVATYAGRAPEEIERRITLPIEIVMRNVPRATAVRSESIFGLSLVQLVFEEGTETYWARQRVEEKLAGLELPEGANASLAAASSPAGEILRYELVSDGSVDLMERTTLNEWVVIPRLLRVTGVADVSSFGGVAKQYAVAFRPEKKDRYGLTIEDLVGAIRANNAAAGGSVLPRGSMSLVIRSAGLIENAAQLENVFVKSEGGTPVYLKNVATVTVDALPRSGIFSKDNLDNGVEGIVLMRRGESAARVLAALKDAIEELNSRDLPNGIRITAFHNRGQMLEDAKRTVGATMALGILLVLLAVLLTLRRLVMAIAVATTMPLALSFAFVLLSVRQLPLDLFWLGAIDLAMFANLALLVAERIGLRLGEAARTGGIPAGEKCRIVLDATREMGRPVLLGVAMVASGHVPLLLLHDIEGALLSPLAHATLYGLVGAACFSVFTLPTLAVLLCRCGVDRPPSGLTSRSGMRRIESAYAAMLRALLRGRWVVVSALLLAFAIVGLRVAPAVGVDFLPYLDEGPLWIKASFPAGTSLKQAADYGRHLRQLALEFPEVVFAATQAGRTESWTEPFPPSRVEMMVGLRPREAWTRLHSKGELTSALAARLRREYPTTRFVFTQPIIDMVTQERAGTSASLAVQFSGPDADILGALAKRTRSLLKRISAAEDVSIEQEGSQAQLQIVPDRERCAQYNVRIDDVAKFIDIALGAKPVDSLYDGDRRFPIAIKLDPKAIESPQAIGRLVLHNAVGKPVALSQVASIQIVDGQTVIARENGRRLLAVRADVRDRDILSFVREAQAKFDAEIAPTMPNEYRVSWLGAVQNLARAQSQWPLLLFVTTALLIALFTVALGSVRRALVGILVLPFATLGGVLALYFRRMHFDVCAASGFLILFGMAAFGGLLLLQGILSQEETASEGPTDVVAGALRQLRSILATSAAALVGLLPAAFSTGIGSDLARPIATVIVGGLASTTVLTLLAMPVVHAIVMPARSKPRSSPCGPQPAE